MLRVITAEAAYTTEELADILGLPIATIRKYNFHFAKIGVQFTKKQGRLAYTNDDVTIFHELKRIYVHPEMTLEKAVITVAKKFNLVPDTPPNILTEKQTLSLEPLEVQMKDIQSYIDEKFEERERQLISMAREIRALKKAQQQKKSFYKWLKTFFEKWFARMVVSRYLIFTQKNLFPLGKGFFVWSPISKNIDNKDRPICISV